MRIRIEKPVDFEDLQIQFKDYRIIGHIQVGIDGTWFVVDEIKPKMLE
jgi:hypothetical protein